MFKLVLAVFLISLLIPGARADYYLKFTTSGASIGTNDLVSSSASAWIDVSIVELSSPPVDGPVHVPGSLVTAHSRFQNSAVQKYLNVDHLNIYYADVPRSITIKNLSSGVSAVVTSGENPVRFGNAPAFILPDSLLVSIGVSYISVPVSNKLVISAAMPVRMVAIHAYTNPHNFRPSDLINSATSFFCAEGWQESTSRPTYIEVWQAAKVNNSCNSVLSFAGKLTHRVVER